MEKAKKNEFFHWTFLAVDLQLIQRTLLASVFAASTEGKLVETLLSMILPQYFTADIPAISFSPPPEAWGWAVQPKFLCSGMHYRAPAHRSADTISLLHFVQSQRQLLKTWWKNSRRQFKMTSVQILMHKNQAGKCIARGPLYNKTFALSRQHSERALGMFWTVYLGLPVNTSRLMQISSE